MGSDPSSVDTGIMDAEESEYEKLLKLDEDYHIDSRSKGPLVGEIISTEAIRLEYAENDIYRDKADALPRQFAWLREIARDGNCGWRALLFAALEMLLRFGDSAKFAALITRLESMNLLLSRWYGEGESYVEFRDETLEVLQRLYRCYSSAAGARQELATAFRNPESGSIIYYFRMIVSAWIREHSCYYQDFIYQDFMHLDATATVAAYCAAKIDIPSTDIEELGIHALWEAVIKGMGINIGIVNLDNSPGDTCHIITYPPPESESSSEQNLPTIWMLRRIIGAGHYDLLYKGDELPETQTQVMRASDSPYNETNDLSEIEHMLSGTMYNDLHYEGAAELEDPFYLAPYSTFYMGSTGRPSDLPYVAGAFKSEYAPYLDEEEDMLFEPTFPLPFVAAQTQECGGNISEFPVRAQQQGQGSSEQGGHCGIQIREAIFPRKKKEKNSKTVRPDDDDSEDEKEDGDPLVTWSNVGSREKVKEYFVPSPIPQENTAAKRVQGELESKANFRTNTQAWKPIIEEDPTGSNKGKGKGTANAKRKGPGKDPRGNG